MGATARLSEIAVQARYEDVPEAAREQAKRMMMDTIGVALAASDSRCLSIMKDWCGVSVDTDRLTGTGGAHIIGSANVRPPEQAALVNGTMAHHLNYDDISNRGAGHPSAPILPAVLAIAESIDASPEEAITAFVLGVETEHAMAKTLNPGIYTLGWHPTAIFGQIGAAVASGKILGLGVDQMANAIGIAASGAGGLRANFGSMTRGYHAGRMGRCGVEAAFLASEGFTASDTILEEEHGGFVSLYEGDPPAEFGTHIEDIEDLHGIIEPTTNFKAYPCCGSTHSAIDATIALRQNHDIDPDDVESIRISAHPKRLPHTDNPKPTNEFEAKFSVQFTVSTTLYYGTVELEHVDADAVHSSPARNLLSAVSVSGDEETFADDTSGARVIITADGNTYEETAWSPNEMTHQELVEKFRTCASTQLSESSVQTSLDLLNRFEELESVSELMNALDPCEDLPSA